VYPVSKDEAPLPPPHSLIPLFQACVYYAALHHWSSAASSIISSYLQPA